MLKVSRLPAFSFLAVLILWPSGSMTEVLWRESSVDGHIIRAPLQICQWQEKLIDLALAQLGMFLRCPLGTRLLEGFFFGMIFMG